MSFERLIFASAVAASFACGCGDSDSAADTSGGGGSGSETIVLVHGAFAGAWAWDRVAELLTSRAHVVTLDLPAHGLDMTPVADATLASYAERVVDRIDQTDEQFILVGHSMGGQVISEVAERRPDRIKRLIYVAAFLVPDGTSLLAASAGDTESELAMYVTPGDDGTASLAPEGIEGAFCSDCSDEDLGLIEGHLRPEPLSGFTTPITTTQENWGRVPRRYVETLQDAAIGPAKQKAMYTELSCEKVFSIDSGHGPFLTHANELADALTAP